ncbi:MAG: riboflavin synthase, partial [Gammaproteobacteria bacterium]
MFTGIVQAVGKIHTFETRSSDARVRIETGVMDLDTVNSGDSIAVNGCCLTVIEKLPDGFTADASTETLSLTTLGDLKPGDPVNLEAALTLSAPLGGHLVIGHVDGVGTVRSREADGRSVRF